METISISRKNFFLIIFLLLINSSFSNFSFKYPYAFKLNNKNIFLIHQKGIDIFNKNFSKKISNVLTFPETEQITSDASLSKVTSVIADDYIICLINDEIYIFDQKGKFLKKSDEKITTLNVEYYSLIYLYIKSNMLYFIIAFISSEKLYLYSYNYNILNKSFTNYAFLKDASSYNIKNSGLSCHYMKYYSYNNYRYLITCLYYISYYEMGIEYYDVTETTLSKSSLKSKEKKNIQGEAKLIKAVLSSDEESLLIGWITSQGVPYHWKYNINGNINAYKVLFYGQSYCKIVPHGFQFNYYHEKNEYIYTCLFTSNGWTVSSANILVETLDINNKQLNYTYKYNNCIVNGYSIVYSNDINEYYIISDAECSNKLIPLNLLFGDLKQEEEELEDQKEKELEKEIEEINNKFFEELENEIENNYDFFEEELEVFQEEKSEVFQEENLINEFEKESIIICEEEKIYIFEEEKKFLFEEEYDKGLIIEEENIYVLEKESMEINYEIKEEEKETEEFKEEENLCKELEKCEICDKNSINQNLCIKCNNLKGYYFLNIDSISNEKLSNKYIDCVNKNNKPSNIYFDEENKDFRFCYETCSTCDKGGNWQVNNCKTCQKNYIINPGDNLSTNCVIRCPYYYYYTTSIQYKCTKNKYCPLNYNLFIKEKDKCIENCKNDDIYKYQYDNFCLKQCPNNTLSDDINFICKDNNISASSLTETFHIFLDKNITNEEIKSLVEHYIKFFNYTSNHVSIYESNNMNLTIYKNSESILHLSLDIPKINFDNCYSKIKSKYNITQDLITIIQSEKVNNSNNKIISLSIYNPINQEKIIYDEICSNDTKILEESLDKKIENLDFFIYLANQGIDLLNPNHDFFTDLCFHFKSPYDGSDIPLKERFKLFYPNVSLCEKGCSIQGINTTTNTSICECTLKNLINSNFLGENIFLQSAVSELKTLLQDTNIEVLRCYKDLFNIKLYLINYGSYIIFGLLLIEIILTIIYYKKYIFIMKKYLFNLTQAFILYLLEKGYKLNNKFDDIENDDNNKMKNNNINQKKITSGNFSLNNFNNIEIINLPIKTRRNQRKHSILLKNKNRQNKLDILKLGNNNLINPSEKINSNSSFNSYSKKNKNHRKTFIESSNRNINSSLNTENKYSNFFTTKKNLKINMEEYIKTDPDDLDYDNAIKLDKRTLCIYFSDNLKSDLLILNIFCNYEQLNPWPIKFLLFILNVDLYFLVNGLFFTENYLSDIFNDSTTNFFDFVRRFIDRIYYITLIGICVSYIINFFFFEEKIIKKLFKREKNNITSLQYEMCKIIKNIKNRYDLFVLICFFVAIIVWYYVFCFNNIYPSMKKEWIITSIVIVFAMQLVNFFKILLESIIRFIGIKCKSERIFKISQFLA